jgi:hypothetical protein
MIRRHVPDEAVEFVLTHYDTSFPATPRVNARPAEVYIGAYLGRRLKVYVEIGTTPPKVKTVAWTS